jgi:hypothetical protein
VKRQVKIPSKVLASARTAVARASAADRGADRASVEQASPKKPMPPAHQPRKTIAREKVIAALKKLHPMD